MKEITKKLIQKINTMEGSIIGIGLEEKELLTAIDENDRILSCELLDSISLEEETKKGRKKYLPLKKLRKKMKKKKHSYLLVNTPYIVPYFKQVIKDSIYITNEEIILYNIKEKEWMELLNKRYHRYNITWKEENGMILIDVTKAKNNKIKDFFYYIEDTISNGVEYISEFLLN